jgi:Na+-transporting NADH:ubiquinone oxidoreductase subunit NqrC
MDYNAFESSLVGNDEILLEEIQMPVVGLGTCSKIDNVLAMDKDIHIVL